MREISEMEILLGTRNGGEQMSGGYPGDNDDSSGAYVGGKRGRKG